MVERDLGEATIVYEAPDDGTVEHTLQNEHAVYFQDHWMLKTGEDDEGNDTVVRVPRERVHHVERSVEAFEEEVSTLRTQVRSIADDLRTKLLGGGARETSDVQHIDVETGEPGDDRR